MVSKWREAIRAEPRYAALPLVMLSSVSIGAKRSGAPGGGPIDCYLTKPVRQSDLYDAIATTCRIRRGRRRSAPCFRSLPQSPTLARKRRTHALAAGC
jgi:CheY-like chemotaxis protein